MSLIEIRSDSHDVAIELAYAIAKNVAVRRICLNIGAADPPPSKTKKSF